jgi:hypothetical protein
MAIVSKKSILEIEIFTINYRTLYNGLFSFFALFASDFESQTIEFAQDSHQSSWYD